MIIQTAVGQNEFFTGIAKLYLYKNKNLGIIRVILQEFFFLFK